MVIWKRNLAVAMLTVMLLLAAGCGNRSAKMSGKMTYHDTELGLAGAIMINDRTIFTTTGNFISAFGPGTYTYTANSLVGSAAGAFDYNGSEVVNLHIPMFTGWSIPLYNIIVAHNEGTTAKSRRWERGKQITFWVEPIGNDPGLTEAHRTLAIDAFVTWQEALSNQITFTQVSNRDAADITLEGVPKQTGTYPGLAVTTYSLNTFYILRSRIEIRADMYTRTAVYQHEIGHAIGLGHSTNRTHVMYHLLAGATLHPEEVSYARLLYSIVPGSEQLISATTMQPSSSPWPAETDAIYIPVD